MNNTPKDRNNKNGVCAQNIIHVERVAKAIAAAADDHDIDRLTRTFKVLSDPNRLKMLVALMDGEMCVCDLAAFLGTSVSAVSHQLRRLRDMALVKCRRDGQMLFYMLDDSHVSDLLRFGLDHVREK